MKYIIFILLLSPLFSCAQIPQDVLIAESKSTVHKNFTPKELGAKLEFWFDNNHIENMVSASGRLYSQTDETGNYVRRHANAAKPFINRSGIDGDKGHISYEGAEGLRITGVTKFNHSQGELFVVIRRLCNATVGLTNNQFLCAETDSTAATNYLIVSDFANSSSQNNSIGINSTIAGTSNIGYCGTKSLSDKKIIVNIHSSGTAYTMGFDGILGQSMTWSTSNNGDWFGDLSASNLFTFGYRTLSSGTSYSAHYEYEVIYCNTELTSGERTKVMNYLNAKHNCYATVSYALGVIYHGSSNCGGQSVTLPNRLKVSLPKGYIQTGTNVFSNLLFGTNNEGDGGSSSQFGSELSFVSALSEYLNQDIYLEKHGVGGSRFCIIDGSNPATASTNSWNTGAGDLYPVIQGHAGNLQTRLTSVNASNKWIYFMIGGENDTFYIGDANGFQTNLEAVITGISAQMTSTGLMIITQIKTLLGGSGSGTPLRIPDGIVVVRDAAVSIVANHQPGAILFNMAPYAANPVHYVDFQHVLIGRDAFEAIRPKL